MSLYNCIIEVWDWIVREFNFHIDIAGRYLVISWLTVILFLLVVTLVLRWW